MKNELVTVDSLSGLTLDELGEMANTFGEKCQQSARKTVQDAIAAGTALLAAKAKCEHGQWIKWLSVNWDYHRQTAFRYMHLASNVTRVTFENEDSMAGALRQLSSDVPGEPDSEVPRESRKPGRVKVADHSQEPRQQSVQADEIDDDPTPDPPTIRKTAAGSKKVAEADKPKTRPVVPEIVEELTDRDPVTDWLESHSMADVVAAAVAVLHEDDKKAAAKALRKAADKLDPPTKFIRPDLQEVSAYFAELKAADPETFFDFYESKGWMVGKVSMKDWRASARKWVRENQANPFGNGKANGNGHTKGTGNGRSRGLTAEDVFSAESLARGSQQR